LRRKEARLLVKKFDAPIRRAVAALSQDSARSMRAKTWPLSQREREGPDREAVGRVRGCGVEEGA